MFDKYIINRSPFTIHANLYFMALKHLSKSFTGKLNTLIGIEYFWLTVFDNGLFKNLYAEIRFQRIGNTPADDKLLEGKLFCPFIFNEHDVPNFSM